MWYDNQAVAREDTFERSNKKKIVKSLKKSLKKRLTREKSYDIITLAHTRKGDGTELWLGK